MTTNQCLYPTTDYPKLTVPQLKAICKELKITGYSKLGKAALLEKLLKHGGHGQTGETSSTREVIVERSMQAMTSTVLKSKEGSAGINSRNSGEKVPTFASDSDNRQRELPLIPSRPAQDGTPSDRSLNTLTLAASNVQPQGVSVSTPPPVDGTATTTNKPTSTLSKRKENPNDSDTSLNSSKLKVVDKRSEALSAARADKTISKANQSSKRPANTKSSRNSFKALLPLPKVVSLIAHPLTSSAQRIETTSASVLPSTGLARMPVQTFHSSVKRKRFVPLKIVQRTSVTQACEASKDSIDLAYLDVTSSAFPILEPIKMPVSLSERKRVHAWSIILSGISDKERRQCALVSRMFRYAVYLSASAILSRTFNGRRFSQLTKRNSPAMTNYWPLLRQLREESKGFKLTYNQSFLARFFGKHIPIDGRLWTCPDHERQLGVAIRFIMTRVWLAIMVPMNRGGCKALSHSIVIDAQEVVKDEIWTITVLNCLDSAPSRGHEEKYYVLEPTCEVIGKQPEEKLLISFNQVAPIENSNSSRTLPLRVDWTSYVEHRLMPAGFHDTAPMALLSNLKWTNEEEYEEGISKLWLSRIQRESEVGAYKKKVAQRNMVAYINFLVSGEWMSASSMAQTFSGSVPVTGCGLAPRKKQNPKVNLFLPAHHLVESVHFATSKGEPLHPALASIQTPGREYFILQDNGMEVGCEEDGIWAPWTELLLCNERGLALENLSY